MMIASGELDPSKLVRRHIRLDEAPPALMDMATFQGVGITVISPA